MHMVSQPFGESLTDTDNENELAFFCFFVIIRNRSDRERVRLRRVNRREGKEGMLPCTPAPRNASFDRES